MRFLITGVDSGLGKYLLKKIPDSIGLNRYNFDEIKNKNYDTIIHCAFNKENKITDYKKYINDNIILTQKLKKLKYKKFVYISTIDVYQEQPTLYAIFKKLSETLMSDDDLILRCSMIIGETMKPNHVTKIKEGLEIGLSKKSKFNYILMEDLFEFFNSQDYLNYLGIVDFISNDIITIESIRNYFNSKTKFGEFIYENNLNVINPIFKLDEKYNKSSFDKIKNYFNTK